MLTLDVGCGSNPKGLINCDLFVKDVLNHRWHIEQDVLDVRKIKNFILCSAEFLPFKSNCFEKVFSSQVIEHVSRPALMFYELTRVLKQGGKVIIETVHYLGERFINRKKKDRVWIKKHHINKFNFKKLRDLGIKNGCQCKRSYVLTYFYFPFELMCLFKIPYEIGVSFQKENSL